MPPKPIKFNKYESSIPLKKTVLIASSLRAPGLVIQEPFKIFL